LVLALSLASNPFTQSKAFPKEASCFNKVSDQERIVRHQFKWLINIRLLTLSFVSSCPEFKAFSAKC
jgi:hypothetical protein